MSDPERKQIRTARLGDDRPAGTVPPQLREIYGSEPDQSVTQPVEVSGADDRNYALERKIVICSLLGLGVVATGVATGVIKIDLSSKKQPLPPLDPETKPDLPSQGRYEIVTTTSKEELTDHLSQEPYRIVGDPRLKTDNGYTVQTLVVENQAPRVELSDAWKKVLSSPYTAENCSNEIGLVTLNDSQGAREVAGFLLAQMRSVSWEEGDFAVRMGLLAMNLDPSTHDQVIINIEFLDALWQEQRSQQSFENKGQPEENIQPESEAQPAYESEYVLSSLSESPADPGQIQENLKSQKNLKVGKITLNFGFSLIGPVEYARVLASRAGIISSMDQKAGAGAVYEVTEATDLGLSLFGLPIKYLKVKVVSGEKMPEGILWFVSATDMKENDKFFGWRVASAITG